jgi:glycosyltransferase involved in cell wall biosynthesis
LNHSSRVLQVVLSLDPGGTERLVLELVRRLHAHVPMAVCCLDRAGLWARDLQADGIVVSALGRMPGFQPTLGRGVAAAARSHRATVIHAHHYSPFVYSALARLFGSGARVVFTEHGRLSDAGPSMKRRMANQIMSRFASAVYTVSAELRGHLVDEGFPPAGVGVIYNGIDVGPPPSVEERARVRHSLDVSDRTLVIGTIARLDPVKDLGTLIGAVAQLPIEVDVRLVVIGDGAERSALERAAAAQSASGRVCFLGQREDARSWLAGCDLYANSSISEGISLTILEAMAAGLPVIATRVGGTPEIVDETCGRLVPSRSRDALAAALLELGRAPHLRTELGAAARRRAETKFTIQRMVEEYRAVYERLGT